jgi:GNAT superfamily N-acetyltransferase
MIYYQDGHLKIRTITPADPAYFCAEEIAQGWEGATPAKLERRMADEAQGKCATFIAEYDGVGAGYVYVYFDPDNGPFAHQGIPEIVDFAVLARFRRRGIGSRLLDTAEAFAARLCDRVYLGVGLHSGYGSAQRLYVRRGYLPDGSGVWYGNAVHPPYAPCINDDDLVLYLSRPLPRA